MSTDFSVKPVGVPVATVVARPQPEASRDAVQTELPAPQTTTATETPSAVRNELGSQNPHLSRDIEIDRAAASIVFRVVDNRTGQVLRQYPDEARLRARAYYRQVEEAKSESGVALKLDQRA
jgi:uncharacterized FlaG/YvyC family protein